MEDIQYAGGSLSLSTSLENEALEKADAALAMSEQLQSILRDVTALSGVVPKEFCGELQAIATRTKALYEMIDSSDTPLDINCSNERLPSSKLIRMGINREVIELHLKGIPSTKIAALFGVSPDLITKFCQFYNASTSSQKVAIRRWSILDTVERMEEMGALIYRQLANLSSDPQNQVKYVESQIKLIKQAEEFMKSWETRRKIEKTQAIIQEIFQDELKDYPQLKEAVLRRFTSLGVKGVLS